MREYKIVATRDEHHLWNDSWIHMEAVAPVAKQHFTLKTRDLVKAEEWLEELKEKCKEFDAETQRKTDRNAIRFYQSNLRIMTREVTDWEDLDNAGKDLVVGDNVEVDGLVCEILEINEADGVVYYDVTPVSGYARGFVRTFTADSLQRV